MKKIYIISALAGVLLLGGGAYYMLSGNAAPILYKLGLVSDKEIKKFLSRSEIMPTIPAWFELREMGRDGVFMPTPLNSKYIESTSFSDDFHNQFVGIKFTPEGFQILGEITERNIAKQLAFYIDGKIFGKPQIVKSKLTGPSLGVFIGPKSAQSEQEARMLMERLNAGRGLTANPTP